MAGKGINITITADPATTKAALELVRRELRETGSEGKRVGEEVARGMEMIKSSLAAIGIGLGLREVISDLREIISSSLELGEQMTKLSQRTGLSVDTISTLHYAAAVTNSDFDGLINGLGKMNKLIGEAADGNKKAAGFVQGLGLDAKELAGRADGAEIAFHRFIDRLAATENPIRRNQFAMELLGKAGSAQIPMLIDVAQHWDEFKDRATAAGVQLNAETAKALEDTNRRLADMKQRATGAGLEFTEGLTPALSAMLGVLAGGKSTTQAMIDLGQALGRTFAFAGMAAYGLASGAESAFAGIELLLSATMPAGSGLTEAAARDLAAAEEYNKKAIGMRDIAFGTPKAQPGIPGDGFTGNGVGGFEGNAKTGKEKSDNAIAVAAAALLEEQAKLKADMQKHLDQAELAELETQHKLLILGDTDYYREKLRLQEDALTVEEDALRAKLKTLADLNERQKGDTLLKRDKSGNSAEELKTQREMVQVQEQLNALAARHLELQSGAVAEQDASNRKAELAGLELAANLERERNDGLTAQIALLRRKAELEAQRGTAEGGSPADAEAARALGEIAVKKLQIAEVSQQISDIEAEHKARIDEINDAVEKDPRLKLQGQKAIDADYAKEAAQLKDLVAQYDALAQTLGGETLVKAQQLRAELAKLNHPDNREEALFGKTLAEGIEGMSRRIADATAEGKENFHSMAKSMEKDLLDLAIKLAEQKWLTPALSGASGAKAPWDEKTGPLTQTPALGAPRQSAVSSAASSVLGAVGLGGLFGGKGKGSGDGQQVKIIIQNESSTPVGADSASGSFDLDGLVVHAVLKDINAGGALAKAFGIG